MRFAEYRSEIREREIEVDAMPFKATHKYARIAPRKARLILDLIRGRDVEDALALLKFSKKRAAVLVDKVVRSAVANAGEQEADTGALFVKEAWADPGPTIKRFQPKDRGKAYSIMKRTSHLVVTLDERQ
jgi:large subunit ribosomal protein L22